MTAIATGRCWRYHVGGRDASDDKVGVAGGADCFECESSAVEGDAGTSDEEVHSSESESRPAVGLSAVCVLNDDC